MKKETLSAILVAAAIALGGCSGTSASPNQGEAGHYTIPLAENANAKHLRTVIDRAAEKAGWDVAVIDNTSSIASKYVDGKSASVVIHHGDGVIAFEKNRSTMSDSDFEDEVEGLQKAIEKALQAPQQH